MYCKLNWSISKACCSLWKLTVWRGCECLNAEQLLDSKNISGDITNSGRAISQSERSTCSQITEDQRSEKDLLRALVGQVPCYHNNWVRHNCFPIKYNIKWMFSFMFHHITYREVSVKLKVLQWYRPCQELNSVEHPWWDLTVVFHQRSSSNQVQV